MEKGSPPSPAPSNTLNQTDDLLHSGFQQLIQHNAASTPYTQPGQHSVETGSHIGSNPHSRYSSPGPQTNMMTTYDHHTPINHASPYTAPSFTGGYQTVYPLDPSPYPQLPDMGSSAVGLSIGLSRPCLTKDANTQTLYRLRTMHIAHPPRLHRHRSRPME
jgi:hypothetical protein